MSFFVNESLVFIIYLKFQIQQYITCQGSFAGKGLNSKIKVQKYAIFTGKNDVTLNITKVKYTINFQIIPFKNQNKTQIASDTHKYKKIVKKMLKQKPNHTYKVTY